MLDRLEAIAPLIRKTMERGHLLRQKENQSDGMRLETDEWPERDARIVTRAAGKVDFIPCFEP